MGGLKTISIIIAANIKGLENGLGKANESLASFASKSARLGSMMSFGVTAPLAAMGKSAFDTFAQFENGMTKVLAVTGASAGEIRRLTEEAKHLGETTQFTARQVADLQLVLGRKGFDTTAIIEMQGAILDLALATGEDLSLAAETVSTSINAFQLDASEAARVANTLASAAANSSIQLSTFATAFGHAGASANAVGIDLEELSAMMGVLMDNGIKASKAGTGLRKIFMKLSEDGTDFTEVLDLATQGEMGLQRAMKLAGVTAANQLLILANNKNKVAELTKEYRTNKTRLSEMAKLMGGTAFAKVKIMQSAIEGLKIEFGGILADYLFPIIDGVKELANKFSNLDSKTKKMIITGAAFAAVAGPMLLGIGALLALVNPLAIAVMGLAGAFAVLSVESQDHRTDLEKEQDELEALVSLVYAAAEGTDERTTAIQNLQDKYPDFLKNLGDEKTSNENLKIALKETNAEYFKKIKLQSQSEELTKLQNKKTETGTKLFKGQKAAMEGINRLFGTTFEENLPVMDRLAEAMKLITVRGKKFAIKGVTVLERDLSITKKVAEQVALSLIDLQDALPGLVKDFKDSALAVDDFTDGLDIEALEDFINGIVKLNNTPVKTKVSAELKGLRKSQGEWEDYQQNLADIAEEKAARIQQVWLGVMDSFASGFTNLFEKQTESVTVMVDGFETIEQRTLSFGEKFNEFAAQFLIDIGKMILKAAILAGLMAIIFPNQAAAGANFMGNLENALTGANMFGGQYADGGNPPVGKMSLVGERGPELFVPTTSGTIIPNNALGGGGGTVIPDVRISGNDLLIVFDRAERRRNRR